MARSASKRNSSLQQMRKFNARFQAKKLMEPALRGITVESVKMKVQRLVI